MKKMQNKERNWPLVVIASIVIIFNIGLFVVAVMNVSAFGWWSLAILAGAALSIWLSALAIKRNEPAWLLLDFILPN
jgi:hypothetical protein